MHALRDRARTKRFAAPGPALADAVVARLGAAREALARLRAATEELQPTLKKIEATDWLIDQIAYRLYGLTEDEINIVKG